MEKPKLFLPSVEGIDLYAYFGNAVYPEKYSEPLLPFDLAEENTYCLSLPLAVVSPRIYGRGSRLAAALGMSKTAFVALCRGVSAIAPTADPDVDAPTEPFRDDVILRSPLGKGYRGPSALRYLCERYLEGLVLREDAVISAVRVDHQTAAALLEDGEEFLHNDVRMAYAQVFSRSARVARVTVLQAPEIIVRNEISLLCRALERLAEYAPFDVE